MTGMKHFLCFNEIGQGVQSRHFDLARVAALTSRDVGGLDVHVLYDGEDMGVIRWFRDQKIKIFRYESSLKKLILEKIPKEQEPILSSVLQGTLLRLEIPVFLKKILQAEDPFVLYTDTDVLFLKDISEELKACRPRLLALRLDSRTPQDVPSGDPEKDCYNSGVMVMNVHSLYEEYPELMTRIGLRIGELRHDQDALNLFLKEKLECLSPLYNWTPYFGKNEEARIFHFHGPKPMENVSHEGYRFKRWLSESFFEMRKLWMEKYATFESRPPVIFEHPALPIRAYNDSRTIETEGVFKPEKDSPKAFTESGPSFELQGKGKMTDASLVSGKRIIVVLGMHRSGTSVITRALQVMGVDLGKHLMPGMPTYNQKGFFEDVDLNRINLQLFRCLSSEWDVLMPFSEVELLDEKLDPLRTRAIELLREKTKGVRTFAMKDPRLPRVLPFWKKVFEICGLEASYVIAVRHPLSVSTSLGARDKFSEEKAHYLWLAHILPSILETVHSLRVVVDYDRLMDSPGKEIRRLARSLRLEASLDLGELLKFEEEFLEKKMCHSRYAAQQLREDPAVPSLVIELSDRLEKMATDELSVEAPEIEAFFSEAAKSFNKLSPALRYMTRQDRQLSQSREELSKLEKMVAEKEGQISKLRRDGVEKEKQLSEFRRVVAGKDEQLLKFQRVVAEKESRISALLQNLESLKAHNAELHRTVGALSVQVTESGKALNAQREEACKVRKELEDVYRSPVWNLLAGIDRLIPSRLKDFIFRAYIFFYDRDFRGFSDKQCVKLSGFFNPRWYLATYPDVAKAKVDPLIHYLDRGGREGRFPGPDFDGRWYLREYSDVLGSGVNPLVHYLRAGRREGRMPLPETLRKAHVLRLINRLHPGKIQDFSLRVYAALSHNNLQKLSDEQCVKLSGLFDARWYLETYPDVAESKTDPLCHYLTFGWVECRFPGPRFDGNWYLGEYPHVAEMGENPLVHYLRIGRKEGCRPGPSPDSPAWSASQDRAERFMSPAFSAMRKIKAVFDRKRNKIKAFYAHDLGIESPDVSILIPTYGRFLDVERCLRSMLQYPPQATCEVLVINDNPFFARSLRGRIQDSRDLWERFQCRVFSSSRNIGFVASINALSQYAKGRDLFLLNDDTEIASVRWLDALVDAIRGAKGIAGAGSLLLFPQSNLVNHAGLYPVLGRDGQLWNGCFYKYFNRHYPDVGIQREVPMLTGAALLIPRDLFMEAGCLDNGYLGVGGFDDSDLCNRLAAKGYKWLYVPDSVLFHHEGKTRKGLGASRRDRSMNQRYYRKKWEAFLRQRYSL